MDSSHLVMFDDLRRRWGGRVLTQLDQNAQVARLIQYLKANKHVIQTLDDVLIAILTDADEEELTAIRCVEGVAVTHASDGWWLLLPHGVRIDATINVRDVRNDTVDGSGRGRC
jgi:hypothetical protein